MAKSKYFPDLANGESFADVEQIEAAFELVEKDMENAGEKADQTFSSTSKNAQSGVAIAKELEKYQKTLPFDTKPTKGSTNPVTSDGVNTAINNLGVATAGELARYVLKETGKGLSSNDYTDAEKQKNADNESHIGNLSELSKSMFGSTSVDKPKSLVQAINTMAGVVDGKAASNIVGIKLLESSEGNPRPLTYLTRGLYYIKGPCSLTNAHGTYTYTFDNLVYVENDGVQNYQLTVYEPTGITILTFGKDSTEIEKKTYSYDQFITATDYASYSTAGVVKVDPVGTSGIYLDNNNILTLVAASPGDIENRTGKRAIVPETVNLAVKAALSDSKRISAMTEAEKENARDVIGAEQKTTIVPWASTLTEMSVNFPAITEYVQICDHEITTLSFGVSGPVPVGYECAFTFQSGATATTVTYPGELFKFVGVDCDSDGDFVASANTNYEVSVRNLSTNTANPLLVARVGVY